MAFLRDTPATKAAPSTNAVDARLQAAAKAEGHKIETALSAFQGVPVFKAAPAPASADRGSIMFGGAIGQGGSGFADRPAHKAAETPVHPRVKSLGIAAGPARDLLSLFATRADSLSTGEPIAADRFDVAAMLNISSERAADALADLQAAGFLVEKRDGALGTRLGYVLGAAVR